MSVVIEREIIGETTRCKRGMCCLSDGRRDQCKVLYCVGQHTIFVEPNGRKECPYMTCLKRGVICGCPVRRELYKRYNI